MTDEKDSTPETSLRMASGTLSITDSTKALLKGERRSMTPQNAWEEGTNIRRALRLHPQATRAWFLAELGKLIKFVDATKTIQDDEEMNETARALLEDFPAMKLEEWACIFSDIKRNKFGPMYGRLKLGELMDCARKWEERRAEYLERRHRPEYDPNRRHGGEKDTRRAILLTTEDLIALGQIKPPDE